MGSNTKDNMDFTNQIATEHMRTTAAPSVMLTPRLYDVNPTSNAAIRTWPHLAMRITMPLRCALLFASRSEPRKASKDE